MTTTLRIHSTSLIHSPGIFNYVEQAIIPFDKPRAKELLSALGIPDEFVDKIINGQYKKAVDKETLVLTV